jgi:excinuclease ABC subunit A
VCRWTCPGAISPAEQQSWVIEGEGDWNKKVWYGARRYFAWLETRAYKMHIRVLLSKYRSYTPCHVCNGARLKDEALLWRLGDYDDAARVIEPAARFRPANAVWSDAVHAALPGLCVHDLMLLPIERAQRFFSALSLPAPFDEAADLLLDEVRAVSIFSAASASGT